MYHTGCMYLSRQKGEMSSSSALALTSEVRQRPVTRLHAPARAPAPDVELYPGILEAVRVALGNRRARRKLARAQELAERGRSTGVRV
jgi:hypothetical protein